MSTTTDIIGAVTLVTMAVMAIVSNAKKALALLAKPAPNPTRPAQAAAAQAAAAANSAAAAEAAAANSADSAASAASAEAAAEAAAASCRFVDCPLPSTATPVLLLFFLFTLNAKMSAVAVTVLAVMAVIHTTISFVTLLVTLGRAGPLVKPVPEPTPTVRADAAANSADSAASAASVEAAAEAAAASCRFVDCPLPSTATSVPGNPVGRSQFPLAFVTLLVTLGRAGPLVNLSRTRLLPSGLTPPPPPAASSTVRLPSTATSVPSYPVGRSQSA